MLQLCLTLCDHIDCSPPGSSVHGDPLHGKNTGVGCHFLLQGIFLAQGSNPGLLYLLHWQEGSFPLDGPPGNPSLGVFKNYLIHITKDIFYHSGHPVKSMGLERYEPDAIEKTRYIYKKYTLGIWVSKCVFFLQIQCCTTHYLNRRRHSTT